MSEFFRCYTIVADVNIFVGKADGRVVHNFVGLTFRDVAVFKKKVRSLADYISTVGAGCRLAARQIVLGRNIPWRRAVPTDTDTRDIPDYLYLLPE